MRLVLNAVRNNRTAERLIHRICAVVRRCEKYLGRRADKNYAPALA
jgi:hypothetical protein